MSKILIVEDDEAIAISIQTILEFEHHIIDVLHDGSQALAYTQTESYDLIILDRQLPGMSGGEICQSYRNSGGKTPILMLTAMALTKDKVDGLRVGADDYLTKPFHNDELLMRVKALLRRPHSYVGELITIGSVRVNTKSLQVFVTDREVRLKPQEYKVLEFMMKHPNEVITQKQLLTRVWDTDSVASTDSVYSCVNSLRKKLGVGEEFLQTVHRVGYRLLAPP